METSQNQYTDTVESILPSKWAILFFFACSSTVTLADGKTGYSCILEESVISWLGIRKFYIYHILIPSITADDFYQGLICLSLEREVSFE